MNNSNRIIIIGGNAAGPSAAAKAKRVNPNAEVILIEGGEFISTGTCELPYLLSGEINDYSKLVFFSPEKFYSEKGVKVLINHFVKSVNARLKKIEVIDRRTNHTLEMEYDKLILTTGSIPNEIPELPYTLDNVFSYKSVSDYLKLKSYLDKNNVEKILIIGSGYIGLEVAENLAAKKYEVTIFDKEELPLPSAELEIRHLIKSIIDENKIPFLTNETHSKFIVRNNKFAQLKHEGRYLDFDLAIVAAGIKPNIYLAESAKLKTGKFGGLIVDSRLKTSDPNIYAAGDNIEVTNKITNRADYFPLATYAHHYGHVAGENAAGGNQIAEAVILNSSFKFFNKFIAQVGLNFEQAVKHNVNVKFITSIANNKVKIMPGSSKVFGKIVYDRYSKLILGASFIGSNEVSGYADLISSFIYNKNTVLNLAKINYNYTPPLSPFINLLSILGRKIQGDHLMKNLTIVTNPLINRDITYLRNKETKEYQFRLALRRIAYALAIEISKEFEEIEFDVETPLEITKGYNLAKPIVLVPVLRAGLSLVNSFIEMIPSAKVGHIGLQRDETTLKPVDYYYKAPKNLEISKVIVLDPMLATGGSSSAAFTFLKNKGANDCVMASLIAAPEGVKKLTEDHPDVPIYTAMLDRELNKSGFILPGLGDAGDRTFGTL